MTIFCYGRGGASDPTAAEKREEIAQAGYQVDYWHADTNSAAASLQRAEIIARHQGSVSISQLSRQYGVSRLSIARIVRVADGHGL